MNIFLGNIDIITVFIICLGFISEHLEQHKIVYCQHHIVKNYDNGKCEKFYFDKCGVKYKYKILCFFFYYSWTAPFLLLITFLFGADSCDSWVITRDANWHKISYAVMNMTMTIWSVQMIALYSIFHLKYNG